MTIRTLIVAPNWIGDALMAQPLLHVLRAAEPDQQIVALAPAWVAPVLAAMAEVDAVLPTRLAHGRLQWAERRTFARDLRARGFDRAIVLPNSLKSALIPWLACIPQRVGYQGELRFGLLNRRLPKPAPDVPMVQRYAALAELLGVPVPTALPEPRLQVDTAAIDAARARFLPADRAPGDALYALCPGAEYGPAKRWPARHFASLARTLLDADPTARVVLLGGPGDVAIAAEIATLTDRGERVLQRAGATQLHEALALLAGASAVVSNDSGLMHVAAALQRPQAAIFGSSDPRHTPPLSAKAAILWLHLECSPCFARSCPLGHLRCLHDLPPASVVSALQRVMQDDPQPGPHTAPRAAVPVLPVTVQP